MKQYAFLSLALFFGGVLLAQRVKSSAVPAAVIAGFQKHFAMAKEIQWEKEGANYEVEFEVGESEQSALFDAAGQLLETEVEIKFAELPEAVKLYLKKHYASVKIKEVTRITDRSAAITYEVEIKGRDLLFDGAGNFMKQVQAFQAD